MSLHRNSEVNTQFLLCWKTVETIMQLKFLCFYHFMEDLNPISQFALFLVKAFCLSTLDLSMFLLHEKWWSYVIIFFPVCCCLFILLNFIYFVLFCVLEKCFLPHGIQVFLVIVLCVAFAVTFGFVIRYIIFNCNRIGNGRGAPQDGKLFNIKCYLISNHFNWLSY